MFKRPEALSGRFYFIFVYKIYVMLTAIKGYYDTGKIVLMEDAPVKAKTDVIITFLAEVNSDIQRKRIPGGLKGKVSIPDDFNEPMEDLNDYV